MAFDYGSIDLGLKNPFKKEGAVTTTRGVIVSLLGIYMLILAANKVGTDPVVGWIIVLFGLVLLYSGLKASAGGIMAMTRYFVGRSQPTSLTQNLSHFDTAAAQAEEHIVAYEQQHLTEMLVGRKNITFSEPVGLLARLFHSFFPRLIFMPNPVRNLAQNFFGAWIKTIVALIIYAFVAFVSLAGFAGETGEYVFPIYSVLLTLYLLFVWRQAGNGINRAAEIAISSIEARTLVRLIAVAILSPVIIGLVLQLFIKQTEVTLADLNQYTAYFPEPHTMLYLLGTLLGAVLTTLIVGVMLNKRINHADPKVEVSELRENWQESVHPNEIFINLDNLVMANRRYKEVPNRVYKELDPNLNEQVEGKGKFFGEMMQEVQPKFKDMELGKLFEKMRFISLISGNVLLLTASIILLFLAFTITDAYTTLNPFISNKLSSLESSQIDLISNHTGSIMHLFLVFMFIRAFAYILKNSAHLFYAEMLFESHLIYFKVEGTFTESKISTGASIHDSTRSENTLVRSSITPWVIVSRIVSSTFAATGIRNLEHPRYVMEMHKDDAELNEIRKDVVNFLKDRESIAAITSERDLNNASQIHQINEQSRAIPVQAPESLTKMDEEAAGYLRQEEQNIDENVDNKPL